MTTIVGTKDRLVSDSKIIMDKVNEKAGSTQYTGPKLYRKGSVIIGTAGGFDMGEAFMKWYGTKKKKPSGFGKGADFEALVLTEKGLYHFDEFLCGGLVEQPFFAVGSGAQAALGALHMGATPEQAILVACKVDSMTGEPVQIMDLHAPQTTQG
jgi:hypothetical protein